MPPTTGGAGLTSGTTDAGLTREPGDLVIPQHHAHIVVAGAAGSVERPNGQGGQTEARRTTPKRGRLITRCEYRGLEGVSTTN